MLLLNIYLTILLTILIIISINSYSCELFENINLKLNTNSTKPKVIVPIYAPWRMYYPYEYVYPPISSYPWLYRQYDQFYPYYDQYNIYQNFY